ncbi:hypothetical protein ACHAWF_010328, partial [Thalassiosira exigua]
SSITGGKGDKIWSFQSLAPWACAAIVFGLGYGIGNASAPGWQRHSRVTSKLGVTKILLAVLILSTPEWAKPRITKYGRKLVNIVRAPFRQPKVEDDEIIEDLNDITDLSNFATKIQDVINVAKRKLELEENAEKDDFNVKTSFLALIQLLWQVKSQTASSRDSIYRNSGSAIPDELLEGMDEKFELADLAYDEHPNGDIKQVLEGMGYNLIKHDTSAVPGFLGPYVAIITDSSQDKTAVIGVKGTSTFENLLTDSCASAMEYNITCSDGGNNTLRCHEGVFISSERLADDLLPFIENLLLPSGYKIVIVGHSLGAGCATILSLLIRASIPSLRDSNKLRVWAFAPPPVLDLESAIGCSSFVTCVVNNCARVMMGYYFLPKY